MESVKQAKKVGPRGPVPAAKADVAKLAQTVRQLTNQMTAQGAAFTKPQRLISERGLYEGRGKLQPHIDALLENSVYKDIANAVMNPGHGNNVQNAKPYPDGHPGDVFLHKSTIRGSFRIPAGASAANAQFQVALLPFAEYPMAVKFGGDAYWQGVADTKYVMGAGIALPVVYPSLVGVYESRLVGKSITIDNDTPEMYRAGNITCCRMPANVDNNFPSTVHNGALTATTNQRIVQTVPQSTGEMTVNLNAVNWPAKEGCYLVSQNDPEKWSTRELPWEKNTNVFTTGTSAVATNTIDNLKISTMGGTVQMVATGTLGYGTDGDLSPAMLGTIPAIVNGRDGSDVVSCIVDGLSLATVDNVFKYKLCIIRELRLKNSSTLMQSVIPRPPRSDRFMQELVNYANSLPGMYPADFNFWNELWKGFKNVIGKISEVLPGIGTILRPVLPPQGQAAIDIIERGNELGKGIYKLISH